MLCIWFAVMTLFLTPLDDDDVTLTVQPKVSFQVIKTKAGIVVADLIVDFVRLIFIHHSRGRVPHVSDAPPPFPFRCL